MRVLPLLIALCLSGLPVYAENPSAKENIAIIKDLQGSVKIKRGAKVILAQKSDNLHIGETLITSANSRIGVIFKDGSVLSLGEKSSLKITVFEFVPISKKFDFKLKLDKGTVLFESGKIGKLAPEKFELQVPDGTIGIRGTKFLVEVRSANAE